MPAENQGNVLIIDNDEGILLSVTTRLESIGLKCLTAQTGAQGLANFDPDRIDLIITDMNMPTLDGLGVIEKVRESSDVPIIVVTGFVADYASSLRRFQNVQLIDKPFRTQDLIDIVETEIFIFRSIRKAA